MTSEVVGFVNLDNDLQLGEKWFRTVKSFRRGDIVIRQTPFFNALVDRDPDRLAVVVNALPAQQTEFLNMFFDLELQQRGVKLTDADWDMGKQLIVALKTEKDMEVALSPKEVAAIMIRWRLAAPISKIHMYKLISKMRHSCVANLRYEFNVDIDMGVVVAKCDIPPKARIGLWLLQDANLWWKGANVRADALRDAGIVTKECFCERCQGADTCRAIKCPICSDGEVTRRGMEKKWFCGGCDFEGSDDACAGIIAIEKQLLNDLGNLAEMPLAELYSWKETVIARLGSCHWLAAAICDQLMRRQVGRTSMTYPAALHALQLLEWINSRNISTPPQSLCNKFTGMGLKVLEFLQLEMAGVRDLRVVYLRAVGVVRNLFQVMDRSLLEHFKKFGGLAVNLLRTCAFCGNKLNMEAHEEDHGNDQKNLCAEEDGAEELDFVRTCAICKELSYCDIGCQKADIMRHKPYCVPASAPFSSKLVAAIFIPA